MPNILVDTSSWINLFSRRDASQALLIETLLQEGSVVTNGFIVAEILQGFRRDEERKKIESRLVLIPTLPLDPEDFVQVGHLSAKLRKMGATVSLIDLLIAQTAIKHQLPLLHYDRDFGRIAKATSLKVHEASLR